MKEIQDSDETLPAEARYLRRMKHLRMGDSDVNESAPVLTDMSFIVCMHRQMSFRLLNSKFIQFDISFKRVEGWYEFEVAEWNRQVRKSKLFRLINELSLHVILIELPHLALVLARVLLTHKSAEAHQIAWQLIDSVVLEDTHMSLQWRAIHSPNLIDHVGILAAIADFDKGGAKGQ